MISGTVIALSLLLPLASRAAPEAAACGKDCPSAETVKRIEQLRRPLPATTGYTEVRFVQMLDAPLILRGELSYSSANELGKRVVSPYQETTTIANGQVEITRPGKPVKRFSLKRAPALVGFLESFSATLAGDAQRLARSYALSSEGNDLQWQLQLVPRDAALAKHVKRVVISGQEAVPQCFEIEESGGDSSLLLVDALADTPLPAAPQRDALQQLCHRTL
ncbi:MAG: outer membrane lipoprotein carrier protein LolA [Rhodanobacteraceae bacterium]|nr:outer membrane lipoprotein carrier protein LolA [Rhodanobacteraceae bacterium]